MGRAGEALRHRHPLLRNWPRDRQFGVRYIARLRHHLAKRLCRPANALALTRLAIDP